MWPDDEIDPGVRNIVAIPADRASTGSEVVILDERIMSAANATAAASPNIAQLNVTKSSRLHFGPKFVSVNQTVHNTKVVKDLSFPSYVCNFVKISTRAERLSCLAATIFLGVCVTLIVVYSVNKDQLFQDASENDDPDTWNITREMCQITPWETEESMPFEPIRLVVIQHTVSEECKKFMDCCAQLKTFLEYNIPYNFIIGNEGRVYEGRGWGKVGAHTRLYNRCALGIGFVGDYREELPAHSSITSLQIFRTKMMLHYGVQAGYLHPDYHVVAAKDLQSTESPGSNLYNELKTWDHYNDGRNYRDKTCEEIYAEFKTKEG